MKLRKASYSKYDIAWKMSLCVIAGILIGYSSALFIVAVERSCLTLDMLSVIPMRKSFWFLSLFSALVLALCVFFSKRIGALLFRYRWFIACGLLVVAVLLQLSGSSIGIMIDLMEGDGSAPLVGTNRESRADEYAIFSPMAFSQCTTDGGIFQYYQDSFRANSTDMFCIYGQPVMDMIGAFRPFQLGYILLGPSYGLSFYWCGRLIFLFMISFEFAYRVLCNGSKALAVGYALLVTLSTAIQWWFSINSLVEMILFGELALLLVRSFFSTSSYKQRLLFSIGIGWCLGAFALAFYPAWQIPFAYVFCALFVSVLLTNIPKTRVGIKDLGLCLIPLSIVAFAVCYVFLYRSAGTVETVMNTVYPGATRYSGGNGDVFIYVFQYPLAIISSVFPDWIPPNATEGASFFSFFPLSLLLPFSILLSSWRRSVVSRDEESKKNEYLIAFVPLTVVAIVLGTYSMIGLPFQAERFMLLDRCQSGRVMVAVDYALLTLLFLSLPRAKDLTLKAVFAVVATSVAGFALCFCAFVDIIPKPYIAIIVCIVIAVMAILGKDAARGRFSHSCVAILVIALASGALVNPIRAGVEGYFNSHMAYSIDVSSGEDDVWITVDSDRVLNNITASLGFKTLNSVNTYPQLDTWRKLDPSGEYEEVYNRYAHIQINLQEGSTEFKLISADDFEIFTTVNSLKKLGVTRVLSTNGNLTSSISDDALELLDHGDGYFIYEIR